MTTAEGGTVWILGAGFSRALGAPLFSELFRSNNRVFAACKGSPPDGMMKVLKDYRRHAPREMGGAGDDNGIFWRDPEDFLDVVQAAMHGSRASRELIETDADLSVELLAEMGQRALAIECSHFLRGANPETERWLPYRLWATQLKGSDTVVTFNYDRIPEILEGRGPAAQLPPHLRVVVPKGTVVREIAEIRQQSSAPVLKLHGSVDWYSRNGDISVSDSRDPATDQDHPVVGFPGPEKSILKGLYPRIGALWSETIQAIGSARKLSFVGYRFPPTDAQARTELLTAIRKTRSIRRIRFVLGSNVRSPDVERMVGLLSGELHPMNDVKVSAEPLFAEDFIAGR